MHRALTHILAVALLAVPCYAQAGQEAITTRPDTVGFASDEIRPFRVNITDEALADLRQRILATRWPEKETVADESQGVPLATMRELARYWATDYDWRKGGSEAECPAAVRHQRSTGSTFISSTSGRGRRMRFR